MDVLSLVYDCSPEQLTCRPVEATKCGADVEMILDFTQMYIRFRS